jgi:hypothetical protein
LKSSAHAADDALALLRIHSRTLYKARTAGKMVYDSLFFGNKPNIHRLLLARESEAGLVG